MVEEEEEEEEIIVLVMKGTMCLINVVIMHAVVGVVIIILTDHLMSIILHRETIEREEKGIEGEDIHILPLEKEVGITVIAIIETIKISSS